MITDKCIKCGFWISEKDYYTFEEAFSSEYNALYINARDEFREANKKARQGDDSLIVPGDAVFFNCKPGLQKWMKSSQRGYFLIDDECTCFSECEGCHACESYEPEE